MDIDIIMVIEEENEEEVGEKFEGEVIMKILRI